jgi:5'-nucleotidase
VEVKRLGDRLRILVTNDDGIEAKGLRTLVRALSEEATVLVAAPDQERSATSHAITMRQPLRAVKREVPGAECAYAVSGTPADCVKLAVDKLYSGRLDLVVSGINHGANLGTDVLYSGTVSAALEGVILGLPAIAFSLVNPTADGFEACANLAAGLVINVQRRGWPADTLLNINFPGVPSPKGLQVTTLGQQRYINAVQEREDPWGGTYYWLAGELCVDENEEPTDVWAVNHGFVSLTPVHFDLTDYRVLKTIADWRLELPGGERE